ncbi:hypothetical protein CBR_g12056 [Chara braunii]|uniref:Protein transport protein SEC23 n=1 Tax=Chara braunii TaxID=69332 RepID=A0A388KQY4_CHABU|nr:hypothetical protein CBR_g12056 [Chara braunii]|eukprot:GBG72481.1 hypothetical protein CBR_g12056 [Chara braunii]
MDFSEAEGLEGLRFSWNTWPTSRIEATRVIVPFGLMCTPLQQVAEQEVPRLQYEPVLCKGCRAVLNPYCRVDFQSRFWVCPFCHQRNAFPPSYASISEDNLPAELFYGSAAVEYMVPPHRSRPSYPPAFLFVVDTCQSDEEDLEACKAALNHTLTLLPDHALVGLISFGTMVQVHDLGFNDCPKAYVLPGDAELPPEKVRQLLGIEGGGGARSASAAAAAASPQPRGYYHGIGVGGGGGGGGGRIGGGEVGVGGGPRGGAIGKFLMPVSDCEFAFTTAVDDLRPNPFPIPRAHRPVRATGAAIAVAVSLLETAVPQSGGRVMVFAAGPCTCGPGKVVDPDLGESIRTHQNLINEDAKYFKRSRRFYQQLAQRLVENGHVLDLFACSLDQVGVAEAKSAIDSTGGLIVMAETFSSPIFKRSLQRLFRRDPDGHLAMRFEGTVEVATTKGVKVVGVIGPCSSANKKSTCVSENELGIGGTCAWQLCCLDERTALAVFFEIVNQHSNAVPYGESHFYIQFTTQYQNAETGERRLRVTTAARRWAAAAESSGTGGGGGGGGETAGGGGFFGGGGGGGSNQQASMIADVAAGFDQEAAAVLMARIAVWKTDHEECFDILRWLDRMLIRLAAKFGDYERDDPSSFRLGANFTLYPQFMFHLRRSQFLQSLNNTPDETAYFRTMINREGVSGSLVMIQPTLLAYSFDGPPVPVLLDVTSISKDKILLFDSWFYLVIHYGSQIVHWKKEGYHNDPAHEMFRKLLAAPLEDAESFIADRNPVPKLIECDQHGSQARFLLAKLNPSVTHNSAQYGGGGGTNSEVIFTEEVSLQYFIDHLQRLAVQS